MSDSDERDRIRAQKQEQLEEQMNKTGDSDGEIPTDPIYVDGGEHFSEIIDQYQTVLVDFYADWCGPCKMMEPAIEAIAANTEAVVAKVDVDQQQHSELSSQHQVGGVPTMVLYVDGEVVEHTVGARGQDALEQMIAKNTGN